MAELNTFQGREYIWRRVLDDSSFEHARLLHTEYGHEIAGSILIAQNREPLRVEYRVVCDLSWRTRTVRVDQSWRGVQRRVRLSQDTNGHWRRDGKQDTTLGGCIDVDLGASPSTNALPVNRLRLAIGDTGGICAAWMQFPELTVARVQQLYRRLGDRQYEYQSLASGFTALIEVDDYGVPTTYAGVWHMIASGPASPQRQLRSLRK